MQGKLKTISLHAGHGAQKQSSFFTHAEKSAGAKEQRAVSGMTYRAQWISRLSFKGPKR